MDTPQVQVSGSEAPNTDAASAPNADIEMQTQQSESQDITLPDAQPAEPESAKPAEEPAAAPTRKPIQFLDFLTSPIVELVVGSGDTKTTMTAHQNLLLESPLLAEKVKSFADSGPRRMELPDEDVEAFGYFLQYQYTRDYSAPEAPAQQDAGEIDDSGEQLLKHARVYTLAEKLSIPSLKSLAHSKIHRINSTSHGELVYARYVYDNTPMDDDTIRKPVSKFWGLRSHVLRHEAPGEFKKLCLDVPEFCFDVLNFVLDQKEKRAQDKAEAETGVKGSGRKRLRSGL